MNRMRSTLRSHPVLVLSSVLLGLAAGCDDSVSFPSDPPATYAEFLDRYPAAYCDGLYACPGSGDQGGNPNEWNSYRSTSECRSVVRGELEHRLTPSLAQALEEGSVRFRPDEALACLDAVRGLGPSGCSARDLIDPPHCAWVLEGTKNAGEAARLPEECAPGTYLARQPSGCSLCAADRSAAGFRPGDACDTSAVDRGCGTFLTCVADAPSATAGHCEEPTNPIAGRGQACGFVGAGPRTVCARGLACLFDAAHAEVGRCGEPMAPGKSCQSPYGPTNSCAIGAMCIHTSADSATCLVVRPRGRGEACNPNVFSAGSCSFADNLICDETTYRCVEAGDGSEGSACIDDAYCDTGARCLAHVCRTGADGSSCASNEECLGGYCAGRTSDAATVGTCASYGPWNSCP